MSLFLAFLGCSASPSDSGDSGVVGGGHTATPSLRPVLFESFEEDRGCWSLRTVERPERYWTAWSEDLESACWYGGDMPERTDGVRSTADGVCVRFQGLATRDAECQPTDPWIRPCSEVAGCCERVPGDDLRCSPDLWED